MTLGNRVHPFLGSLLLACLAASLASGAVGQKSKENYVLSGPADASSTVIFLWDAEGDSRFRSPMNFLVTAETDPRLDTVDVHAPEGWNVFISLQEMNRILEQLRTYQVKWAQSPDREMAKEWERKSLKGQVEIIVVSSKGATSEGARLDRPCNRLADLDSVFSSPRVVWHFQKFRSERGCMVQNFVGNSATPPP